MILYLYIDYLTPVIVHASGTGQLQANPHVVGPRFHPGKPTRRAVATMGLNDLVVGKTTGWDRVACDITGKRSSETG